MGSIFARDGRGRGRGSVVAVAMVEPLARRVSRRGRVACSVSLLSRVRGSAFECSGYLTQPKIAKLWINKSFPHVIPNPLWITRISGAEAGKVILYR